VGRVRADDVERAGVGAVRRDPARATNTLCRTSGRLRVSAAAPALAAVSAIAAGLLYSGSPST